MPEKYDLAKDLTENEVNPDTLDKWEDSSYDSLNKATEAVVVAFLNDQDTQNEIKKSGDTNFSTLFLKWINQKTGKNYTNVEDINTEQNTNTSPFDNLSGNLKTNLEFLRNNMAFDELKTILETKGDLQKFEKELEKSENQDKTIKITANNEKIDHDNDSATAEIFGSEVDFNVEPTNVEPTNVEPTNVEPTNVEPTNVEPTNVEPTNVEPTNVEPTNVEPTNVEPTNVEPTNVEPTNVEPTNVEPTNVEPTKPDIIIDDGSDNGHEVNENPTEMTFSAYIAQVLGGDAKSNGNITTIYNDLEEESEGYNTKNTKEASKKEKRKQKKTGTPSGYKLKNAKVENNGKEIHIMNNKGDKVLYKITLDNNAVAFDGKDITGKDIGTVYVATEGKFAKKMKKAVEKNKTNKQEKLNKKYEKAVLEENDAREKAIIKDNRMEVEKKNRKNIADAILVLLGNNANGIDRSILKKIDWTKLFGTEGSNGILSEEILNSLQTNPDGTGHITFDKEKLKDNDVNHLHAIKQVLEKIQIKDLNLIRYIQTSQTDIDFLTIKDAINYAQNNSDIKSNPFKFLSEIDYKYGIGIKATTGAGTEAQLYRAFLNQADKKEGENGYYNIVDGAKTKKLIKAFVEGTCDGYNDKALKDAFFNGSDIDDGKLTLENLGNFLQDHPDFGPIYLMKLNKQTTRLKDLNDAVSGGLRMQFNRKYDTIDSDYEKLKAGLEGCPLMSGFEDYLNELRKDPNYGNFENGAATLGSLERQSKKSFMMTLDEVLSNQFVGLLSSLVLPKRLQVSGEKDLQMPDSVKKDIMKKLVFTADIGKDLHGIGPRLMNQGSVQFTRDALEVGMNWLKSLGKQVIDIPQSWKEGAFSLDIPIFNLGMMSPLNLKKVQQSDLTKVKAVHSLGMKIDGGLNFGFRLGKMPEGFDPAIWKRFTAAVNASVGIKYNLDYERGIEVNARGLAETLDKVTKKLDIKDVTYDNLGEKAYDILKDENNFEDDVLKDLIKNNKAQFHQMCLSLPSLIGKDLFTTFKSKENDAQAQEDFKLVLYQSFQGFLEGVKACQVKFLDGKTRFGGAGVSAELSRKFKKDEADGAVADFVDKDSANVWQRLREETGINVSAKISVSIKSFMMLHLADAEKLKWMDESLKDRTGFNEPVDLKATSLGNGENGELGLCQKLKNQRGIRGLDIKPSGDGKEIILSCDQNAKKGDNTSATKLHELLNIYWYEGTEPGKDFYYDDNGALHVGKANLDTVGRQYLDHQDFYLFIKGEKSKGKSGVNETANGQLPLKHPIAKTDAFQGIETTNTIEYNLDKTKDTIKTLVGDEIRNRIQNKVKEESGKVKIQLDDGTREDIDASHILITREKDDTITITQDSMISGHLCEIKFIDKKNTTTIPGLNETITESDIKGSIDLGLENNASGAEKLTETKLESREFGIGMFFLKYDIMKPQTGASDYNDFLNHIGGSSTDDISKAVEILQRNLNTAIQKFRGNNTMSVRRHRDDLAGRYSASTLQRSWFEDINNALNAASGDTVKQRLICERIAGIMSHEELLYMDKGSDILTGLKYLVQTRGDQYESLEGPAGSPFPLKGVRNRLMNRMKDQNQEDILKDKSVIDGLFGYTAYYHHKNKEDEGKTYDATVLGQTAVLFGEKYGLEKITDPTEQQKAGEWLKANMETKTDEYDQILGLIATKIGISINDLKQQIPDNENLIFNEDGTLRNEEITLKDGTKVKIQADIVFYLYAACGNESLGLKLNEIKITKPGKEDQPTEKTTTINPDFSKGYQMTVGGESMSANTRINMQTNEFTAAVKIELKKKKTVKKSETEQKDKEVPGNSETGSLDQEAKADETLNKLKEKYNDPNLSEEERQKLKEDIEGYVIFLKQHLGYELSEDETKIFETTKDNYNYNENTGQANLDELIDTFFNEENGVYTYKNPSAPSNVIVNESLSGDTDNETDSNSTVVVTETLSGDTDNETDSNSTVIVTETLSGDTDNETDSNSTVIANETLSGDTKKEKELETQNYGTEQRD